MPAVFGQAGVEHMRQYGTKMEHFAKISVKNHKHSTKNPLSQYQSGGGARRRDEGAHGGVPEHALHVLPDRRRRGRGHRGAPSR